MSGGRLGFADLVSSVMCCSIVVVVSVVPAIPVFVVVDEDKCE